MAIEVGRSQAIHWARRESAVDPFAKNPVESAVAAPEACPATGERVSAFANSTRFPLSSPGGELLERLPAALARATEP